MCLTKYYSGNLCVEFEIQSEGDSMAVSSINNQLNTNYEHLSTMKKINSVADDIANSKNMLNVADGGLRSITENMKLPNSTLDALGIADYDVIGGFDIGNLTDVRNRIDDLDVLRYVSDMNKNQILDGYRMFVQSVMTGQATRGISVLSGIVPDGWGI